MFYMKLWSDQPTFTFFFQKKQQNIKCKINGRTDTMKHHTNISFLVTSHAVKTTYIYKHMAKCVSAQMELISLIQRCDQIKMFFFFCSYTHTHTFTNNSRPSDKIEMNPIRRIKPKTYCFCRLRRFFCCFV